MALRQFSISLLLVSLASATINQTDVNDLIAVVDRLDPDRLKGVWFNAIVGTFTPETCTLYEFGPLYRKRNKVLLNVTKMSRSEFRSSSNPGWIDYRYYEAEISPTQQSTIAIQMQDSQNFQLEEEAVMHRIGAKQYHRVDNEFLVMYGTFPVSVLVRYPDVFNEKYATIVLRWFDRSLQHMIQLANYSACHYSPFSASKLPENLWNSYDHGATTDSPPDLATAMTDNYVELGIDLLTTNSYRDAIVETSDNYFDAGAETAGTGSYDTAVESVTTNADHDVEIMRAEIDFDNEFTGTTPDYNPESSNDGATTLS